MSYLVAAPEFLASAATDLSNIGSAVTASNAAAAAQTTNVLAAADDEVSAAIAAVFSAHGQGFQALGAQAAAFHHQFVKALSGAGCTYTAAEAANASLVSVPGLGPSSAAPAQPLHLPSLSSVINGFVNWLNQAVNSIIAFLNQAVHAINSFVNQAVNAVNSVINSLLGLIRGIFPIL